MPGSAFVALGSNLPSRWGSPEDTVVQACTSLEPLAAGGVQCSGLWRTAAEGCEPGTPDFINAVAGFEPQATETPWSLLQKLLSIEQDFGRSRAGPANQPRILDLDLICFGGWQIDRPGLILPHPRAHRRQFVLQPLAELAPDLILPGRTETVSQLLKNLQQKGEYLPKIVKKSVKGS